MEAERLFALVGVFVTQTLLVSRLTDSNVHIRLGVNVRASERDDKVTPGRQCDGKAYRLRPGRLCILRSLSLYYVSDRDCFRCRSGPAELPDDIILCLGSGVGPLRAQRGGAFTPASR